jgi:hypothetical protein
MDFEFNKLANGFSENQKTFSFLLLQKFILNKQLKNEKFFVGRLSGNETNLTGRIMANKQIDDMLINNMLYGAGIQFINNEDIIDYTTQYNNSIKNSDILGIWDCNMFKQCIYYYDYLFKENQNQKKYICAHSLEPFYYLNHSNYKFNDIFKNKKLLIITSHKETTLKQLDKVLENKIFNKPIFDKTTQFYIYKPPQQNGGSHDNNSWTYHFDLMKTDIRNIKKEFDFDIALVSAGGFGMIISNFIYSELNSSVMYIGGPLQLFFGIIGKRWFGSHIIKSLVNNYWTRPVEEDRPKNITTCEGGCYW